MKDMLDTVIPISGKRTGSVVEKKAKNMPEISHVLNMPASRSPGEFIQAGLEAIGLQGDAKGLWTGYPSLKHSLDQMIEWVGVDWPSLEDPDQSALFNAMVNAINEVKRGLNRNETDRRFVIANFHNGFSSITSDIAGYAAWGCIAQRTVEKLEPFSQPFGRWCQMQQFEEIIFSRVVHPNELETDGLKWKVRSTVATLRDVGVIHRYGIR